MKLEAVTGALAHPRLHVEALFKDKSLRQDHGPGIKASMLFVAVCTAAYGLFAWMLVPLALVLVRGLGWHSFWFHSFVGAVWASYLSPWSLLWEFVRTLAFLLLGTWASTLLLDWVFVRFFNKKGGQALVVFNITLLVYLPWALFMLVPFLGALVALIGGTWAIYWVLRQAYDEADWVRILGACLLAGVPAAIGVGVVAVLLGLATGPIESMDPGGNVFHGITQYALGEDLASASAASLNEEGGRLALRMIEAANRAQLGASQAAAAAATGSAEVSAPPSPESKVAQASVAPAIKAPTPVPSSPAPRAQAQAPAQSQAPTPPPEASAPQPTALPTTVAGSVGRAVASEAAKEGVGQAAKLLNLFH